MINLADPLTFFMFLCAAVAAVTGIFFFLREIVAAGRKLDRMREEEEKWKRAGRR